jgi:hypothetical protein
MFFGLSLFQESSPACFGDWFIIRKRRKKRLAQPNPTQPVSYRGVGYLAKSVVGFFGKNVKPLFDNRPTVF